MIFGRYSQLTNNMSNVLYLQLLGLAKRAFRFKVDADWKQRDKDTEWQKDKYYDELIVISLLSMLKQKFGEDKRIILLDCYSAAGWLRMTHWQSENDRDSPQD